MGSSADRVGRIAGPAVVLLAGALAAVWAFVVPIFQAPDEPAHFDYAISIYSAGRLITMADGQTDWIVSPYTKYLMRASDQERIAWHSSMRVEPGYGTAAYFARVDAGAPRLRASMLPSGRISYLVPAYPFAFYALEALWMRAVSSFTGSIVALFFAARLLCVFLMMAGLYFNYRTALNLGLPWTTSAALVAAIGFFPLTSQVSSYVQPDNLAYALVSATLFFATQLRPGALRLGAVAALGASLGLLAVTKYQFFLGVALPVVPLLGVRLVQAKPSSWQRLTAIAWIIAPSAVLLAAQHWIVGQSSTFAGHGVQSDMNLDYVRDVLATGLPHALGYVGAASLQAFAGCFVSGSCAASFWQVVGWVDTPIVILNATVELLTRAAISAATLAVAAVLFFSIARNALRLLRAALRGHAWPACVIAVADPAINAYLAFLALMLLLYVVTNNAFGIEGRHLYPFIFSAFLCFVWYGPRALRKRHQRLSWALAGILAFYALVAADFALADVVQRYYGPQTTGYATTSPARITGDNAGMLGPVVSAEYHVNSRHLAFSYPRGSRLLADGFAIRRNGSVPSAIALSLDGGTQLPVLAGQYLYPVAEAAHDLAKGYSGFYATIPTAGLAEGAHTVAAYAALPDGRTYDRVAPVRLFFLTGADERFSSAFVAHIARAPHIRGTVEAAGSCRGITASVNGVPHATAGAVLLFRGSIPAKWARRAAAVWLLAGDRPFPARYDERDGTFDATIPTSDFAPGLHRVAAFAILEGGAGNVRIGDGSAFFTEPGGAAPAFLANPPQACADPLRQLDGI